MLFGIDVNQIHNIQYIHTGAFKFSHLSLTRLALIF